MTKRQPLVSIDPLAGRMERHPAYEYLRPSMKLRIDHLARHRVPATIETFRRTPATRFGDVARLMAVLTGGREDESVPYQSEAALLEASPEVARTYPKLLDEMYELAVLLDMEPDNPYGLLVWNDYLRLSAGHVDHSTRRTLAEQRLARPERDVVRHAIARAEAEEGDLGERRTPRMARRMLILAALALGLAALVACIVLLLRRT